MRKIHFYTILIIIIAMTSCNDKDSNKIQISDKESFEFLETVCIDWESDVESVKSKMDENKMFCQTDSFILYYDSLSNSSISYSFIEDKLSAVSLIVPKGKAESKIQSIISEYELIGLLNDASAYKNEMLNTVLFQYETKFDDMDYCILGFTPFVSELYPYETPVNVSLNNEIAVTQTTALVTGLVFNAEEPLNWTLLYGTSPDLTKDNAKGKKSITSNEDLSFSLDGLSVSTTYYSYVYTEIDGFIVKSNTVTFKTDTPPSYAVGDYWPDSKNPVGVVFVITDKDGYHGKIVGMSTTKVQWDKYSIFCTDYGYNSSDGSKNRGPVYSDINTAYSWCKDYGDGSWYLPSTGELKILSRNWFNDIRIKVGHTYIDTSGNYFWSSTQYDKNNAYIVSLITGSSSYNSKDQSRFVIAVKKF